MAKNIKFDIKNTKLAESLNLNKIKQQLGTKGHKKEKKVSAKALPQEEAAKPKARIIKQEPVIVPIPVVEKKIPEDVSSLDKKKIGKAKVVTEEVKKEEPAVVEAPQKAILEKPLPEAIQKEKTEPTITTPPPAEVPPAKPAFVSYEKPIKKVIEEEETPAKKLAVKDFKARKKEPTLAFDSRARQGLVTEDDRDRWRKRRQPKPKRLIEEPVIRPTELRVKIPIAIKDLAQEMKLKASQLIAKLFMQGVVVTLNDLLVDETTIQLLGHEFGCAIAIDTSEEERLQITDKKVTEEIKETDPNLLQYRPPVITFMGHVDHGKTSLIDSIRKSNIVAGEAGAITQHIGAFTVKTPSGNSITILDTPGHEAFYEMRSRGANVTDIVVLVVAGDEGMREQTVEALTQAKLAKVPILVAINKSDKSNFDPEKVYRQLADHELLPEIWGGTTITVNCSATTGKGVPELLDMLGLQAEILELKANNQARARGTILESEMHKGYGAVATILVQNGTLHLGDAIVFGTHYGRIKSMHNEFGKLLTSAGPSHAIKITGLSDLAEAGDDFIVVRNEKEAKILAHDRQEKITRKQLQLSKRGSLEQLNEQQKKKVLNLMIRADVQGSLEAMKTALYKIPSDKIILNIMSSEVGEISESDIELAAASKAIVLGFHTRVESHAESFIKQFNVTVKLHDIIYHAVDDIKQMMIDALDKVAKENDMGKASIKAVFKSSQLGNIAGCIVLDGLIRRSFYMRVVRNGEVIFKGKIASLKRGKEDVKEVLKDQECGIVLEKFTDYQVGDTLEAYDISYFTQEL